MAGSATVSGKPLAHDSARMHVSGSAAYTDDLPEPRGLLHMAVGMSARAHAKIANLDLADVLAADGVVAVYTAADIPGENNCGPIVHDEKIFNPDVVEYAGQPIFAVAAENVDQARKAARRAGIEYEELDVSNLEYAALHQVDHSPGGTDDDVCSALQTTDLGIIGGAAIDRSGLDAGEVGG